MNNKKWIKILANFVLLISFIPTYFLDFTGLDLHHYALSGTWTIDSEYVQSEEKGVQLMLHFYGKDVYLVMDSAVPSTVHVELVSPDTQNVSEDLDPEGKILVDGARLYHLVSMDLASEGTLLLTFDEPGTQAYAFTFGS